MVLIFYFCFASLIFGMERKFLRRFALQASKLVFAASRLGVMPLRGEVKGTIVSANENI